MRGLLQRYTRWFNKRHGMRGTLWEDRFHSVIVQSGLTARTMAAYIDLNSVGGRNLQRPCRLSLEFVWRSGGWRSRCDEGAKWPCACSPGARRKCGNLASLGTRRNLKGVSQAPPHQRKRGERKFFERAQGKGSSDGREGEGTVGEWINP